MDTRFHAVYLLTSLDPLCEGEYYIGYTVNPLRRLRQHNGELLHGARRTSRRGRPWSLVCCVSGFVEDRAALKFEWCWQHPTESARLKHTAVVLKGLHRMPFAVGTLHFLLHAPLFHRLELTLHIFDRGVFEQSARAADAFLGRRTPLLPLASLPLVMQSEVVASGSAAPTEQVEGEVSAPPPSPWCLMGAGNDGEDACRVLSLPPLTASSLFHIEFTTAETFENNHLSHDRCLALPSRGVATTLDLETDTSLSTIVPLDVSCLSQTARAAWSLSGADDSGAESPVVGWGGEEGNLGMLPEHQITHPRGPSSPLSRRSPSSASSSSPPPALLASPLAPVAASAVGEGIETHRIPVRYAYYTEEDYIRDYVAEEAQLRQRLLPCTFCSFPLQLPFVLQCSAAPFCSLRAHLSCLAVWMLYEEERRATVQHGSTAPGVTSMSDSPRVVGVGVAASTGPAASGSGSDGRIHRNTHRILPTESCACPLCFKILQWASLIKDMKRRVVAGRRVCEARRRAEMESRWQARLASMHPKGQRRQKRSRQTEMVNRTKGVAEEVGGTAPPPHLRPMHTQLGAGLDTDDSRAMSQSVLSLTNFIEEEWL